MKMLYQIKTSGPRTDMHSCPIQIDLWPEWRDAVAESALTQDKVNKWILNMHRSILDGHGYDDMFDPDDHDWDALKKKNPGPNARPLYDQHAIRIRWGEWGPEHITVPGDACGLDIDRSIGGPRGGRSLFPHNVDTMRQAYMLITIFGWFGDYIISQELLKEMEK
jgi:hypothetical protein